MEDEPATSADERRREEINEIGRAVKVARNGRGWSLRRLAEVAGLSASLLSAVETGKIVPTVGSLFAISDALDQPAEAFFPARRRPAVPDVELILENAVDPGTTVARPVESIEGGIDREQTAAAPATAPLLQPANGDRSAPRTVGRPVESTRPASRSILRSARVVSRRSSPVPTAKAMPSAPASDTGSESGPHRSVAAITGAVPLRPDRREGSPGVAVRRLGERPSMTLEDGSTWTLPVDLTDGIGQVIEVSIPAGAGIAAPTQRAPARPPSPPPDTGISTRHRVRDRAMTLLVTRGRLRVDAAFGETTLESGDSVVISAGVPHRVIADQQDSAACLIFITGDWDGTL